MFKNHKCAEFRLENTKQNFGSVFQTNFIGFVLLRKRIKTPTFNLVQPGCLRRVLDHGRINGDVTLQRLDCPKVELHNHTFHLHYRSMPSWFY